MQRFEDAVPADLRQAYAALAQKQYAFAVAKTNAERQKRKAEVYAVAEQIAALAHTRALAEISGSRIARAS